MPQTPIQILRCFDLGGYTASVVEGELAEALGKNEGSFTRKLGKALASRIGTRYGDEGLHVEETGTYNRSKVWSVFKGSDGTKAYEFMSFMSFCESREGKSSSNGEINYPPAPQTNSTNSETHKPPDEESEARRKSGRESW